MFGKSLIHAYWRRRLMKKRRYAMSRVPEKVYEDIISELYFTLAPNFTFVRRLSKRVSAKQYPLPEGTDILKKIWCGRPYFIQKVLDDPFDIQYKIWFELHSGYFTRKITAVFEKHNVKFDYETYPLKDRFWADMKSFIMMMDSAPIHIAFDGNHIVFYAYIFIGYDKQC